MPSEKCVVRQFYCCVNMRHSFPKPRQLRMSLSTGVTWDHHFYLVCYYAMCNCRPNYHKVLATTMSSLSLGVFLL
jgi:hypothetical protein